METKLVTTQELKAYEVQLPDNVQVVAFKLVNVGPKTLADAEYRGVKICEITEQQSSFYIISESSEEIRKSMHDLVDRFCNAREGK